MNKETVYLKHNFPIEYSSWMNPIDDIIRFEEIAKIIGRTKQITNTQIMCFNLLDRKSYPLLKNKCPMAFDMLYEKISDEDKLIRWYREIKDRDLKCIICGFMKNLHAHHIFYKSNHPKLKLNLNNGITLCSQHHAEAHMGEPAHNLLMSKNFSN